ncbi:MAG: hypothetical protein ETSY1_39420 [Candidatus Entotheonella factor]|uniref:Uncharacterized protein n=1 Tax=Entotheonella factor TaxID=1429438 RepID=W4L5S8_ENTF1|nr:MAG: hypothetical protein ETSY1_39420 [Candidatus Entotheonella factor]
MLALMDKRQHWIWVATSDTVIDHCRVRALYILRNTL